VKQSFLRIFDRMVCGVQWFCLHAGRGFFAGTMFSVLYIGFLLVTAAWLMNIFGEERTIEFINNHPWLFLLTTLVFIVCTGGMGYWCYTTTNADLDARLKRRIQKHSGLFSAKAA
jgi:hypothetical protein